jgi:hypothetical protein
MNEKITKMDPVAIIDNHISEIRDKYQTTYIKGMKEGKSFSTTGHLYWNNLDIIIKELNDLKRKFSI